MYETNIDFIEAYKRVESFIRQANGPENGVTYYLEQMKANASAGRQYVDSWQSDYNELIRLRGLRNKLIHEVPLDEEICEIEDVLWLDEFRRRLMSSDDPMAKLSRSRRQRTRSERNKTISPSPYASASRSGPATGNGVQRPPVTQQAPVFSRPDDQESDDADDGTDRLKRRLTFIAFAIVIVIIIWLFIRGERTGILMPDSFFRTASI